MKRGYAHYMKETIVVTTIVIVLGAIVAFIIAYQSKKKEKFHYDINPARVPNDARIASQGFLPSRQAPIFQNLPPSTRIENAYHKYIQDDCGGDYSNYECRQKAYVKTMKDGTFDKADLICYNRRHNENDYYACLDSVYGNYLWADRYVGTEPCTCPDGSMGPRASDWSCSCTKHRPLVDRRPVDADGNIVKRVHWIE